MTLGLLAATVLTLSLLWSCKKSEDTIRELPNITDWQTNPSDQFIIGMSDLTTAVSRTSPYTGTASACVHPGAHLHFAQSVSSTKLINVYAPATGTITRVDPCMINGAHDKYEMSIQFAKSNDRAVSFDLSLEPFAGHPCSGGVVSQDNSFFHNYILVTAGESVTKGQLVAKLYIPAGSSDDTHIHFNTSVDTAGFACPNIFNSTISNAFDNYFSSTGCAGGPYTGSGFCVQPGPGEDQTGL